MEKEEHFCTVGGNADWCSRCGRQSGDTSKNYNEYAFSPSNPTSGNTSKGTQNTTSKEHKHPYVRCSVIYNHQHMEAAQVSLSDECIKQLWDIYTRKKEENFTLSNGMDGPGEHYTK